MDSIGKNIKTCDIKICVAPFRQKPVKIHNALPICKYCVKAGLEYSEKQEEILREFEIEENQSKFPVDPKPKKIFSKEEEERRALRLKRKEGKQAEKKKKPVKRINAISKKQSQILSEYSKLIKDIDENRPMVCVGCQRTDLPLSHSHRIRVSLRKDLMTDPNNIDLMCFGFEGSCHDKVESFEWDTLKNVDSIIDYVKINEPSQYWLYYYKNKRA